MGLFSNIFGNYKSRAQTANAPNYRLSPMPSRGDVIKSTSLTINNEDKFVTVSDTSKAEVITSIRCGIGGDLVLQSPTGDLMFYLGVLDGETIWGKFAKVLSSGTTQGGATVTTTCDNITWYGGET